MGLRRSGRKHLHIVGPYLSVILTLALLVVVGGIVDAPLNIEFVTLMHIAFHHLGQLAPENNVVPLRAVGNLGAVLQRIATLGGGHRQASHGLPLVHIADLRLFAHIAYQHHLVHKLSS